MVKWLFHVSINVIVCLLFSFSFSFFFPVVGDTTPNFVALINYILMLNEMNFKVLERICRDRSGCINLNLFLRRKSHPRLLRIQMKLRWKNGTNPTRCSSWWSKYLYLKWSGRWFLREKVRRGSLKPWSNYLLKLISLRQVVTCLSSF